jgi:hypothetical protein
MLPSKTRRLGYPAAPRAPRPGTGRELDPELSKVLIAPIAMGGTALEARFN